MAFNESPSSFIDVPKTLKSFALCCRLSSIVTDFPALCCRVSATLSLGQLSFGTLCCELLSSVIDGTVWGSRCSGNASLTVVAV